MNEAKTLAVTEQEKQRVAVFENSFWQYMIDGRQQYQEVTGTPIPAVTVPRVPIVAGDAAKVDWTKAASLTGWHIRGTDTPASRMLSGRVAHDGEFLYLELTDPCNPKQLYTSAEVFPCDDWEVFLAGQREMPYRQIGVSPSGNLAALTHGEENWRMNVPWTENGIETFSDTSAANQWVVRVALPLCQVVKGGVAPGGKFYLNLIRCSSGAINTVPGNPGLDSWVSFTSVHNLSRLAEMTLEK